MQEIDESPPQKPTGAKRLVEQLLDIKTLLLLFGLLQFGLLHLVVARFYDRFGLSPSDLGLGYLDLLTQAGVAEVLIVIASAGSAMIAWYTTGGVPRVVRIAVACLVVVFMTTALERELIRAASKGAEQVVNGESIGQTLFGLNVQVLPMSGEAATLSWTSQSISPALTVLERTCVIYLGEANGSSFVYSPYASRPGTYRFPTMSAAIRIAPDSRCVRGKSDPMSG